MATQKLIRIDLQVLEELRKKAQPFDTHNTALRRVFGLPVRGKWSKRKAKK